MGKAPRGKRIKGVYLPENLRQSVDAYRKLRSEQVGHSISFSKVVERALLHYLTCASGANCNGTP